MEQRKYVERTQISRLCPTETTNAAESMHAVFDLGLHDRTRGDAVCFSLEEMARHLRHFDDDFQNAQYEQLLDRARRIVLLADQLGLRQIGHVAADVIYCLDDIENPALAATLSRLIRLITLTLDQATEIAADY